MSRGLSPQEHGDLNRADEVYPGGNAAKSARIAELRITHARDPKALQQIDVYEGGSNSYMIAFMLYRAAVRLGDNESMQMLEEWFRINYPDI